MKTLSTFLIALAGVALQAHAATITLVGPTSAAGAFDVSVQVTNVFDPPHDGDDFLGYGFDVAFDHSLLAYTGETAGPLFDDISDNAGLGADVGGTADAGLLGEGDFTEPLVLAILHFYSSGIGSANISVSADNSNTDQGLVYLSGADSFSASTGVDVTPEPGTLLLGAFAGGLLAFRRLRR